MIQFSKYYKPYRLLFAADMLCSALGAAITLAVPLCARRILGLVESGGGLSGEAAGQAALMLALIALRAGCAYFYDYKGHDMGAKMERDMRAELFAHYQRLPLAFFDRWHTGQLLSRLTGDLNNLSELFHHGPENLFIFGAQFAGAAVILAGINVKLALAVFVFLPPMALCSYRINRRLKTAYAAARAQAAGLNTRAEEALTGVRVVKSFGGEAAETAKFTAENAGSYQRRREIYKLEAIHSVTMEHLFSPLILAAVILLGALWVSREQLALPDLLAFVLYISYLTAPLPRLSFLISQFQDGLAGYLRFKEIMDAPPEAPGGRKLEHVRGRVEFRGVTFRYRDGQEHVLKDLHLSAMPGEIVAIAGPSGVGKTTLVSLIPRLYDGYAGQVRIDGTDTREVTLASLRGSIGIVPQEGFLFAGSVLENIRYGKPGASRREVEAAAEKAAAHEFILALPEGYDTQVGQRGVRLSGGQRQRLSIARAFLKNPPILILDEATSALDCENERAVLESMRGLAAGRTAFVIAHRLSTIRAAHRIVMLTDGPAEQGTHEELMRLNGAYARFFKEASAMI